MAPKPRSLIALDDNALYHALKKEAFHGSILDMEIDGKTQQVLLRDFQITHTSNWCCTLTSSASTPDQQDAHVRCHCTSSTPTSRLRSSCRRAIISHVLAELEVSCLPGDLPEFINVDLANMKSATRSTSPT